MRIVLLGPPGGGQGTQAVRLAEELGVPQISTGDLFRHNISHGTKLGLEAKKYLDAGDLVPASLTMHSSMTDSTKPMSPTVSFWMAFPARWSRRRPCTTCWSAGA